jgi:hypothetical protein
MVAITEKTGGVARCRSFLCAQTISGSFVDTVTAAIVTSVNILTTLVHAVIDAVAFLVEPTINLITLSIQTIRKAVSASRVRAIRLAVKPMIDTITLSVQTVINAIALLVETIFKAVAAIVERLVTRVSPNGTTYNQQYDCNRYCFPDIHVNSPLYPYQIMSSVRTTRPSRRR